MWWDQLDSEWESTPDCRRHSWGGRGGVHVARAAAGSLGEQQGGGDSGGPRGHLTLSLTLPCPWRCGLTSPSAGIRRARITFEKLVQRIWANSKWPWAPHLRVVGLCSGHFEPHTPLVSMSLPEQWVAVLPCPAHGARVAGPM